MYITLLSLVASFVTISVVTADPVVIPTAFLPGFQPTPTVFPTLAPSFLPAVSAIIPTLASAVSSLDINPTPVPGLTGVPGLIGAPGIVGGLIPLPGTSSLLPIPPPITDPNIRALSSAVVFLNFLLAILYEAYKTGGVAVPGVGGLKVSVGTNLFQLIIDAVIKLFKGTGFTIPVF